MVNELHFLQLKQQFIISVVPISQYVVIKNMYINEYGLYYASFTDNFGNSISDQDVGILIVTRSIGSQYE